MISKWSYRLITILILIWFLSSVSTEQVGKADVAPGPQDWNNLSPHSWSILRQLPGYTSGNYLAWFYPIPEEIRKLVVRDINLDGWADVALVTDQHRLQIWLQDPDCHALRPTFDLSVDVFPRDLDIGYINSDSLLDIAVVGVTANTGISGGYPSAIQLFFQSVDGFTGGDLLIPTGDADPNIGTIRLGDVNGDGLTDLVTTSREDVLNINEQQPGGGFSLLVRNDPSFSAGQYPGDLAIADFNGDGRNDVALQLRTNSAENLILYYQDPATGSLQNGIYGPSIPGGLERYFTGEMVAGDVTGDGRADIITLIGGNMPAASIVLYRQLTGGGLSAPEVMTTYQIPTEPHLGDMNGDGRLDLVVLNDGYGSFTVHFQLPAGGLGAAETTVVGHVQNPSAGLGDVSGDGLLDIVYYDDWSGLAVFSTESKPLCPPVESQARAFPPIFAYSTFPLDEGLDASELVAGDVDGNGLLDFLALISKDFGKTYVQVIKQAQPDQFVLADQIPIGEVFPDPDLLFIGLSAGDLNGDGRLDISAASTVGEWGKVAVALQAPGGGFLPPFLLDVAPNPQRTFIEDWTGDGLDDLGVLADSGLQVFTQLPGGALSNPVQHLNGLLGSTALADAHDWNLDGRTDLIAWWRDNTAPVDMTQKQLRVFLQELAGVFTLETSSKFISGSEPEIGDLNEDGRQDIVIPNNFSNYLAVFYQLPGGGLSERQVIGQSMTKNPGGVLVADLNFDQLNDLLVFNTGGSPLGVFTQNGAHTLDAPVFYNINTWNSPYINAVAAIDSDDNGAPEAIGFSSPDFYILLLKPLPLSFVYLPAIQK